MEIIVGTKFFKVHRKKDRTFLHTMKKRNIYVCIYVYLYEYKFKKCFANV